MTDGISKTGLAGAFAALGVSACCVLPMTMMLLGLGGSWLAIFGKIAAVGFYVAIASALLLLVGWIVALRRHAPARTRAILAAGTAMAALSWVVLLNEAAINDYLITLM